MLQAEDILENRYQLKRQLGDNAVRQTWLATDLQAAEGKNSLVVVKLLAFGGQVQWENLKLFEREAQILQHLDHPRIPKYLDNFCIDDRSLWFGLVEEYIPGDSLKDLMETGKRFTEKKVRKIAVQVLKILIHLHELHPQVLHRDIKPSNLICGEDGKIYLVDFGAVQDKAAKEGVTFTVVGTYGYTPMEQFGGRAVPASDLYALGATLIHLLTGISPGDLPQRDLRIQFTDKVSISPDLERWLQKLVEPAPEQRFKSAQDAFEALKNGMGRHIQRFAPARPAQWNNSGCGIANLTEEVPEEIIGWNWGAFLMPWLWCFPNQVWMGLLSCLPTVGWIVSIFLGAKGNEWAWKSRYWRSIEQFKAHQRGWAIAGILIGLPVSFILWSVAIGLVFHIFD
jgi:serine/threonine protein kinase